MSSGLQRRLLHRGYAIAVFSNADVDPDNFDDFKNGIHGLLDRGERQPDSWGTIAAWAWGASRCMDYFETDKDIDAEKVAVVGHSRGGKTALWAAAEDQRFAMAVAMNRDAEVQPWQGGNMVKQLQGSTRHFPTGSARTIENGEIMRIQCLFDMHMLIALIAPRAVYVTSASEDLWADPRGSYLSLYHSLPVFRLYQQNTSLTEQMPPLNSPVKSGKLAIMFATVFITCLLKDWNWFMDFGDTVLK